MRSLREQASERSGTYSALTRAGVREADFLAGARAALEAVRAKHREVRPGISGGGGPLGQPKAAYVHLRDIDALLKELE